MPPKKRTAAKKTKAPKTIGGAAVVPDLTSTSKPSIVAQKIKTVVPAALQTKLNSASTKKRRAESPIGDEKSTKKAKGGGPVEIVELLSDGDSDSPEVAPGQEKSVSGLSEARQKEFKDLRFTLSDHIPRSMAAILAALSYEETPLPDTVPELVDIVISELTKKVLAGQDIEKEMTAIKKIDQGHWDGDYDEDPDGFARDVRKRLNSVEDMVARMTSMYLKDIMKELTYFGARGGTNAAMAEMIVEILHQKAIDGKSLKREYRMIKGYSGGCYGGCGDDSGLGEGSDDEEEDY